MEDQQFVDTYLAALARHGRATASVHIEHVDGQRLITVVHEGWRLTPRADGKRHGASHSIGSEPDPAFVEKVALLVRERTKAQPGDSLATWDATVLPALRRAMVGRPELDGAKVTLEREAGDSFEVKLSGKGWDFTREVSRGPMVCDIEADCATLASCAAYEARNARQTAAAKGDPDLGARALAAELLHRPTEVLHGSAPCAAFAKPEPTSKRTPLPEGWRWDDDGASCARGREYAGVSAGGAFPGRVLTHDDQPPPPDVLAALRTEAKRLGLPWVEPGAPEGYTFKLELSRDVVVYDAAGCVGIYWPEGIDDPDDPENTDARFWPPEHEAARQHAARMLGHEAPPIRPETMAPDDPRRVPLEAPAGYTFKPDYDGDIEVFYDGRYVATYIAKIRQRQWPDSRISYIWEDHEEARQWAAHLLGEVAPPLHEEGAAS